MLLGWGKVGLGRAKDSTRAESLEASTGQRVNKADGESKPRAATGNRPHDTPGSTRATTCYSVAQQALSRAPLTQFPPILVVGARCNCRVSLAEESKQCCEIGGLRGSPAC